jgi:Resolvase, N terminal domain
MVRHHGKFVSYLRVSTKRQGESGLGLEAQRHAVESFLNGGAWTLVEEFVEVESGKADHNRPALHRALDACKVYAATLVIAKLDRLSRDAHFLLGLQKAGVEFVAADNPHALAEPGACREVHERRQQTDDLHVGDVHHWHDEDGVQNVAVMQAFTLGGTSWRTTNTSP